MAGYDLKLYVKTTNLKQKNTMQQWSFLLMFPSFFWAVPQVLIDIFFSLSLDS